jgi:ABC-2 type transport system ATP-binding protein
MEYVLQTNALTKKFGRKAAVNGLNINVKNGDIYGFIGRNGAGKTTFIRMVAGLARPTGGSIRLFESEDLELQRRKTGTMIENPAVFPHMTARENLIYYCKLLGLDQASAVDDMLKLVGLQDTGKKKAKNFSLGMKQRLAIAIALLDNPEFLMLDEPINGLDPSGIKEIRELILKLNKERNITILISSHILGELEKIATRYGVINNGVMVDEFTKEELETRCKGELEFKVDNIERAVEILSRMVASSDIRIADERTIYVGKDIDKAGLMNTELAKNGVMVTSCSVTGQDLEAYFMYLMDITDKSLK